MKYSVGVSATIPHTVAHIEGIVVNSVVCVTGISEEGGDPRLTLFYGPEAVDRANEYCSFKENSSEEGYYFAHKPPVHMLDTIDPTRAGMDLSAGAVGSGYAFVGIDPAEPGTDQSVYADAGALDAASMLGSESTPALDAAGIPLAPIVIPASPMQESDNKGTYGNGMPPLSLAELNKAMCAAFPGFSGFEESATTIDVCGYMKESPDKPIFLYGIDDILLNDRNAAMLVARNRIGAALRAAQKESEAGQSPVNSGE